MSTRSTVLGLAVVGAFFVGRFLAPEPEAAVVPARVVAPGAATTTIVREIVRPETRSQVEHVEVPAAPAALDDTPPAVIEQRAKALAKARTIVDAAIQVRRWTGADAAALLEVFPLLDRDGAATILTTLITPINAGNLKLETSGSLLDPT